MVNMQWWIIFSADVQSHSNSSVRNTIYISSLKFGSEFSIVEVISKSD